MSALLEVILAELRADPEAGRELVAELVKLVPALVPDQVRPELLTVRQAAEVASVSDKTIRRKIADGELESVRIGASLRVRATELERYLDSRRRIDSSPAAGPYRGRGRSRSTLVAAAFRELDAPAPIKPC